MTISLRISRPLLERLDSLADARGLSRSQALRAIVSEASQTHGRSDPIDEDELKRVVSQAARDGSVQAMKLAWEMLKEARDESARTHDVAWIDELAARRPSAQGGRAAS